MSLELSIQPVTREKPYIVPNYNCEQRMAIPPKTQRKFWSTVSASSKED